MKIPELLKKNIDGEIWFRYDEKNTKEYEKDETRLFTMQISKEDHALYKLITGLQGTHMAIPLQKYIKKYINKYKKYLDETRSTLAN